MGNRAGEIGEGKGNGELIPSVSASLACEFFNYYTAEQHLMSCEAQLNCPLCSRSKSQRAVNTALIN